MFILENIVRPNIRRLTPYSSARDEFKGTAKVYLDANENSFGSPLPQAYNRYPHPLQPELKQAISQIKGVPSANIFLGNGSDEAIDLLYRIFCEPGTDNVILCPPTYGMYQVSAHIHNVAVIEVPLHENFELNVPEILEQVTPQSKLLFLCSPNNPTGNSLHPDDMELLIQKFTGIVVIDEAYINYSAQPSRLRWLTQYPNLVILQTFSKAWGLAALRLGMAFAGEAIIELMNRVKPPYNINAATTQLALQALQNIGLVNQQTQTTVAERKLLAERLANIAGVQKVFPSDANFLLVKVADANRWYNQLLAEGIVVRNRSSVQLCHNCLRITIGTPTENNELITALEKLSA